MPLGCERSEILTGWRRSGLPDTLGGEVPTKRVDHALGCRRVIPATAARGDRVGCFESAFWRRPADRLHRNHEAARTVATRPQLHANPANMSAVFNRAVTAAAKYRAVTAAVKYIEGVDDPMLA